jgi:ABC-type amino acid transport substrate-binding protein
MFAAVIIISTFTGMIASSLTESRLGGIHDVGDLQNARVGSIAHSAAQQWLDLNTIGFDAFPDIKAGPDAVAAHKIDAFVYDRPLLAYAVRTGYNGQLRLLPGSFGRQDYAFALPQGSKLREHINETLLRHIDQPQWSDTVKRTLGTKE